MTQAHRIYCVLAAAAMLAVQGPAQGADVNRIEEIRQTYEQRASVIKSVRYTLAETGTRPLEGTKEYLKADPHARMVSPDKDFVQRSELTRTREGAKDAYELTVYPVDGVKAIGQVRRTWDGESGKMLDVLGHTGAIETEYRTSYHAVPEGFGPECLGRTLTEWMDRAGSKLQVQEKGGEIELTFPTGSSTEYRFVLDPDHGFMAKSYAFINQGELFGSGTVSAFRKDVVDGVAVYTPEVYETVGYIQTVGRTDKKVVPINITEVKLTKIEFNLKPAAKEFDLTFPDDTSVYDPVLQQHLPVKGGILVPIPALGAAKGASAVKLASAPAGAQRTSLEQAIDSQAAELGPLLSTAGVPDRHAAAGGSRIVSSLLWLASASLAGIALFNVVGWARRRERVR